MEPRAIKAKSGKRKGCLTIFVSLNVLQIAADPEVARWSGQSLSSGSSQKYTASPILKVHSPMRGATFQRSRMQAN